MIDWGEDEGDFEAGFALLAVRRFVEKDCLPLFKKQDKQTWARLARDMGVIEELSQTEPPCHPVVASD